jgi:hypothetical protein
LGNLLVIWYIFHHFGKFCLEKSGNPAASWCKNHGRNGPVWLGSFIIVCQCGNHPVNNGGHFLSAENARKALPKCPRESFLRFFRNWIAVLLSSLIRLGKLLTFGKLLSLT